MISYHNGSRHKRAFEGLFRSLSFFFHPTKIRLIHPQRIVSPSTVKPRKKRRNSNETKLLIKCLHFINFPLFCLVYDDNGWEKKAGKMSDWAFLKLRLSIHFLHFNFTLTEATWKFSMHRRKYFSQFSLVFFFANFWLRKFPCKCSFFTRTVFE